jgi:nitroreductase
MIEAILDIAHYSPSESNSQLVEWIVLHDPKEVRKVANLTISLKTDSPVCRR